MHVRLLPFCLGSLVLVFVMSLETLKAECVRMAQTCACARLKVRSCLGVKDTPRELYATCASFNLEQTGHMISYNSNRGFAHSCYFGCSHLASVLHIEVRYGLMLAAWYMSGQDACSNLGQGKISNWGIATHLHTAVCLYQQKM